MELFVLLVCLVASSELVNIVHGQSNSADFISIDCGIPANETYSSDRSTGLDYVSDAGFTDAGLNARVDSRYNRVGDPGFAVRYRTVRYFPDGYGKRSCYTLRPVRTRGGTYLVRATFYYGNYDRLNRLPIFDLHLGVNQWATVNVTAAGYRYIFETVAVLPTDFVQVCLVNTGLGTPFISGLDLRPLKAAMYPEATVNQSLVLLSLSRSSATYGFNRYHFWPAGYDLFRLNYDPYDRLWQRYGNVTAWTNITITDTTTADTVDVSNISNFDKPTVILQSAVTPVNGTRIDVTWSPDSFVNNDNTTYLLLLYFAELQRLPTTATRKFDILIDNTTWNGSQGFTPQYLSAEVVKRMVQGPGQHTFSLVATPDATLPPILNAIEIYTVQPVSEIATDDVDAKAMMMIRETYALKKNWMGDPCAPKAFVWAGLDCSYSSFGPPRITTLHMSSSGLTGAVISSFGDLKYLQYLDLSNNNLSGPMPDFLAQMPSLTFLDLSSNQLTGPVPAALLEKRENGSLELRIGNNKNISCDFGASTCEPNKKKNNRRPIVAIVVPIAAATLLLAAGLFIQHQIRNKIRVNAFENREFTYNELKHMTSNFKEEIGRGGFGAVFLGYLEDGTPIAIKMRSKTSSQGDKEFLAEAEHLTKVHHRNLVSLIGYCKDKKHMALVYEYMHAGSLEGRLRGEASAATPLTWHQRLKIALDSAQGLEYLHKLCQPPLIHRDVKTQNILLSSDLKAKIADFGLMKAFADDFRTHVTTQPAGTLGYLDPEYYNTFQLSDKSDAYSFGVVLLELVTGQPPAVPVSDTEFIHVSQCVRQKLSEGSIESIVDPRMGGDYDINSVWKVVELALQCKEQPSQTRPSMTEVLFELKECLELEASHATSYSNDSVPSSEVNLGETSDDNLHGEARESEHWEKKGMLELEQVGTVSATFVGPDPR